MATISRYDQSSGRSSLTRHRPRALLATACAAILSASLVACGGGSTGTTASGSAGGGDAASGQRSRTLIVGTTGALTTIDPIHAESYAGNPIDGVLYERLVKYDENNKIVPALATEFTVAPDAKSIAITLASGVVFHDGSPLTADDVAFTLDRTKKIGQGVAGLVSTYAGTEVTDATHLTIKLSRADSSFLGALSKVWIVNKKLVQANAGTNDGQSWLQSHDAGSGPFRVADQSSPKETVVTAFADYRVKDADRPETIRFKQIDVSATLRDSVRKGDIDIAANMSAADAESLKSDPKLAVVTVPQLVITVVWMNVDNGPTANPQVRKALQLAYDYQGGLDKIRNGYGKIADGIAPDGFSCRPKLPQAATNLDQAKSLLQSAGVKDLKLTLRYQPLSTEQTREATLLQSNLKSIGVDLTLQPITFPEWLNSLTNKATIPQMMLAGDSAQYPDLGTWLSTQYLSTAIGTTNRTGYSNPEVDQLIIKGLSSADPTAACQAYQQAQEKIAQDAPGIFMYSTFAPLVYRKGLTGVTPGYTIRPIDFADVRLAK